MMFEQEHARHEAAQKQLQELTFKPVINRIRDVGPIISMQDPGRHLAQVCLRCSLTRYARRCRSWDETICRSLNVVSRSLQHPRQAE
jgi:hypothetical protein